MAPTNAAKHGTTHGAALAGRMPEFRPGRGRVGRRWAAAIAMVLSMASAASCTSVEPGTSGSGADGEIPKNRVGVDMAVSSEKVTLLTELARSFNDDKESSTFKDAAGKDQRAFVRITRKASGAAATLLAAGWPDDGVEGPRPVVWSPSASSWGAILNQRLSIKGDPAMAPPSKAFMLTPLVIAMPKPMASALGYPGKAIGWADIIALAKDPAGWGAKGHPEWGAFKIGKTNPNFSTSGLSATIAQYYAAVGKTEGLSLEELDRPNVAQFAKDVESSVVHYGDITMTFLNNWFRTDARGTSLTYVSAVAVEEKSVIDYNLGNPDGVLDAGETPRTPRIPLVAVYPKEGTLFSDNPFIILDAPWVSADQKAGAAAFQDFVLRPEAQTEVLKSGFRPGNPAVPVGAPVSAVNGVDANQPQTTLQVPEPAVLVKILDAWAENRKSARVMLVVDVSGSMGDDGGGGETKLDLAKRAAIASLDQFKDDDDVGLRIFTTNVDGNGADFLDLVPIGPIGTNREQIATKIRDLLPLEGTPLYAVTGATYKLMKEQYDPKKINAVVLLTDGENQDPLTGLQPDHPDFDELLASLRTGAEGTQTSSVRVFPIAYGSGADIGTLRQIAEATQATAYDASNPKSIEQVFINVVSNF